MAAPCHTARHIGSHPASRLPPAWRPRLAAALLAAGCGVAAAQAEAGSGRASPPGGPAPEAAQAAFQRQRAHCLTLRVAAVQAECLRQAERDLARRLADARARPAAPPASAASGHGRPVSAPAASSARSG